MSSVLLIAGRFRSSILTRVDRGTDVGEVVRGIRSKNGMRWVSIKRVVGQTRSEVVNGERRTDRRKGGRMYEGREGKARNGQKIEGTNDISALLVKDCNPFLGTGNPSAWMKADCLQGNRRGERLRPGSRRLLNEKSKLKSRKAH